MRVRLPLFYHLYIPLSILLPESANAARRHKLINLSRPDNIVDQGIGPPGAGHAIEIISEGFGTFNRTLYNNVTTAYDCCVLCQQAPLCAWGYLQVGFGDSTPLPEPLCVLETDYCECIPGSNEVVGRIGGVVLTSGLQLEGVMAGLILGTRTSKSI